ncbi:MAG: 4-hydroxy-3-methylbut-2-enyl diphosphate reductase [Lachnospiraceae bacterium]|nr:4-hydroxy-3-methylbut-2-enyl diphosphate reductase [Lachnospiraceae bacterium]
MEIIKAKTAGFCFGVKRAMDTVYEQLKSNEKIYTYGPIIHNEQVVEELEEKGVTVINSFEEIERAKDGILIIRTHGVPKEVYRVLEEKGIRYVDATCPFVKRIHSIVEKKSMEGDKIIIIGNEGHPEVEGIRGWCENEAQVVESVEQAKNVSVHSDEKITVVSQTTFNLKKFQDLVEILKEKRYNVNVANTICNATEERQTEARGISKEADVMIVIGGAHSSNSRKLYEICSNECEATYFIQTLDDLYLEELPKSVGLVGITAGASTPNNIIEEVQNYVRSNF